MLEFAKNSKTGQEAMQIGRVEAGATAPTTPLVRNSAGPAKGTVAYPGTVQTAKARATSARTRAHTNGARATMTGTRAATTGCTTKVERRTIQVLMVPSNGTRKVTASLDGKNPVMASATLAVEIIFDEIAPKVEEKEDSKHWKPGRLGKSRHW